MKKLLTPITFALICFLSLKVMAQNNAKVFEAALRMGDHPTYINANLIVHVSCIILFFFSITGLFFKRIKKICKWTLIISCILLILAITNDILNYVTRDSGETTLEYEIPNTFF